MTYKTARPRRTETPSGDRVSCFSLLELIDYESMKTALILTFALVFLVPTGVLPQQAKLSSAFKIARLKYTGGGDWYNDQQEEVNLLAFVREHTIIDVDPAYEFVEITNDRLFTYPFIFMTGHGNISFTDLEVKRLRTYLENG